MNITDPIADMLTRIRNANRMKKEKVDIPNSKLKQEIARILKEEGFISSYKSIPDRKQGILRLYLRYTPDKKRVIKELRRISTPGLRVYVSRKDIPKVLGGLGIAIISTSRGVMTAKQCRQAKIGGEVLCYVW